MQLAAVYLSRPTSTSQLCVPNDEKMQLPVAVIIAIKYASHKNLKKRRLATQFFINFQTSSFQE